MSRYTKLYLSSKAAIDLASIMVGVIIIGLIGGVIAATVFAVIPWAQDNAAKQQLESIHTAQNAAYGLSADPARILPEGQERNSFTNSQGLSDQGLLSQGSTYCTLNQGKDDYEAYSLSGSGKVWFATNKDLNPVIRSTPITVGCSWLGEVTAPGEPENPTSPEAPEEPVKITYADTRFLLNCPTAQTSLALPMKGLNGKLTIKNSDSGTNIMEDQQINSTSVAAQLEANQNYELIFEGTFSTLNNTASAAQSLCYRAMSAWGTDSGTTQAYSAFANMRNLTRVPESIPVGIRNTSNMFNNTTAFNQPLNNWDVSNVTEASSMFNGATSFNQPLNNWDVSKVSRAVNMFSGATNFSNNLSGWELSNATEVDNMFKGVDGTQLNLNNWVLKNSDISNIFQGIKSANFTANNWNLSNATTRYLFGAELTSRDKTVTAEMRNWTFQGSNLSNMFSNYTDLRPNLSGWKLGTTTVVANMFSNSSFNQPINDWDMSEAMQLYSMFENAKSFNQPLNAWNVSKAVNMSSMFNGTSSFNQTLNDWDVSNVTGFSSMFYNATSFNQPLNDWELQRATRTINMFSGATNFSNNLSGWNLSNVEEMDNMFKGVDGTQLNLNNWTVKSSDLGSLFQGMKTVNFTANNWNLTSVVGSHILGSETNGRNKAITAEMRNWTFQGSNLSNMFSNYTDLRPNLSGWKLGTTTVVKEMFSLSSFNQPIDDWDVSEAMQLYSMFYNARSFNQPLNSWDVSKAVNMSSMFYNASTFNQPLNSWDVSNTTGMSSMFNGATNFNHDISSWNVTKANQWTNFSLNSGLSNDKVPAKFR